MKVHVLSMATDTFDIFRGFPGRSTATWADSVVGIDRARQRMQEMAASVPGDYFIYYGRSGSILDRANNGPLKAGPLPALAKRSGAA
jgi:hypothetical protein